MEVSAYLFDAGFGDGEGECIECGHQGIFEVEREEEEGVGLLVAEVVGQASSGLFFLQTDLVLVTSKESKGCDHNECCELGEVHEVA